MQLAQIFTLVAAGRHAVDQGELAGHGVAGAAIIARRRLQVGVIVQTDFARADALRAKITELGWNVMDTAKGPQLTKL